MVASNIIGSKLDNSAKKLFNYKEIIAPILQFTVPEFKGYSVEEIIKMIDADSDPEIRKEVSEMSGIGESLVIDARLDDLQRLVIAGKIGSVDEAKNFYPSLEEDDIQEIFNSLHNDTSNQN